MTDAVMKRLLEAHLATITASAARAKSASEKAENQFNLAREKYEKIMSDIRDTKALLGID